MIDKRLIGTWKSDRRKTLAWAKKNGLLTHPRLRKQPLISIVCPLFLAYDERLVHYLFDGEYDRARYRTIAKDEKGNLGTVEPCDFNKQKLWHTTFENHHSYWVMVDGIYREYFRKLSNRNMIIVSSDDPTKGRLQNLKFKRRPPQKTGPRRPSMAAAERRYVV